MVLKLVKKPNSNPTLLFMWHECQQNPMGRAHNSATMFLAIHIPLVSFTNGSYTQYMKLPTQLTFTPILKSNTAKTWNSAIIAVWLKRNLCWIAHTGMSLLIVIWYDVLLLLNMLACKLNFTEMSFSINFEIFMQRNSLIWYCWNVCFRCLTLNGF